MTCTQRWTINYSNSTLKRNWCYLHKDRILRFDHIRFTAVRKSLLTSFAMATQNQPLNQLEKALENLFKNYDTLQESLESLSKDVFNIPVDARDEAVKINVFGDTTRYNLICYLRELEEMSSAMKGAEFEKCKAPAETAKFTMNVNLKPEVGVENADEMLKAVESVVELLRDGENNEQESDADMKKLIESASEGANSIIKEFVLYLLRRVKEEMRKAVNDSDILKNADQLEEKVDKVKRTIAETKNSYSQNISALDKVISLVIELSGKETSEDVLLSLKANAETLGKTCTEKLSIIQ